MIDIIDGKAVVSKEAMALPLFKKVYNVDKVKGKASFERWMRFIYYSYNKKSIYRNYLPEEREKKVVEMLFPDKSVNYFKQISGMKALIEFYIESTYSFKEILYRRLLQDIEGLMDRVSKIELTKTIRVRGDKEITFYSQIEKKNVTETVKLDTRMSVDNTEEKLKAMDTLDKLLAREEKLKAAIEKERISNELKSRSAQRMFDR